MEEVLPEYTLEGQDATLKGPDFSKDVSIKNGETPDGKAADKRDNKGGM